MGFAYKYAAWKMLGEAIYHSKPSALYVSSSAVSVIWRKDPASNQHFIFFSFGFKDNSLIISIYSWHESKINIKLSGYSSLRQCIAAGLFHPKMKIKILRVRLQTIYMMLFNP